MTNSIAEAGWYPDPLDVNRRRYWAGSAWTDRTESMASPTATGFPPPQGTPLLVEPPIQQSGSSVTDPPTGHRAPSGRADSKRPLLIAAIGAVALALVVAGGWALTRHSSSDWVASSSLVPAQLEPTQVPESPSSAKLTRSGSALLLTWDAPSASSTAPVDSYVIRVSSGLVVTLNRTARSYTLPRLAPGSAVLVSLSAVNRHGASTPVSMRATVPAVVTPTPKPSIPTPKPTPKPVPRPSVAPSPTPPPPAKPKPAPSTPKVRAGQGCSSVGLTTTSSGNGYTCEKQGGATVWVLRSTPSVTADDINYLKSVVGRVLEDIATTDCRVKDGIAVASSLGLLSDSFARLTDLAPVPPGS